ncbi:MAG: hypothetical protein KGJ79_02500 [Alphaproteobacteria bacterium]|nr:hypothetical protein [Alphaproteobacteria bacterium]MDE2109984.1 hypothetical protein [Alphaproteobacteria bacterium]MDE2494417.1 hypothetical protein [Alphaproteobacteria bacterium]
MPVPIREGFDVFVHDGDKAIGAVRKVSLRDFIVYVENGGDFLVPMSAVKEIEADKVVLDCTKLQHRLRNAIGHAHEGEDPNIP